MEHILPENKCRIFSDIFTRNSDPLFCYARFPQVAYNEETGDWDVMRMDRRSRLMDYRTYKEERNKLPGHRGRIEMIPAFTAGEMIEALEQLTDVDIQIKQGSTNWKVTLQDRQIAGTGENLVEALGDLLHRVIATGPSNMRRSVEGRRNTINQSVFDDTMRMLSPEEMPWGYDDRLRLPRTTTTFSNVAS